MVAGHVVRFDSSRGYGFIAPESGGEDIFLHVNDLLVPEAYVRAGLAVEFEVEEGGRGLKASSIRLAQGAEVATPRVVPPGPPPAAATRHATPAKSPAAAGMEGEDPTCDVLSSDEYSREVTELLLRTAPSLTGDQILQVRHELTKFAESHGWIED